MTEPINLKFKIADDETVKALIADVVSEQAGASGLSPEWSDELVRDIQRALSDARCFIIQRGLGVVR